MVNVTVVFTNGNIVNFAAQEFDADLKAGRGALNRYPYRDAKGKDSAIHLTPNEVTGVFVTPGTELRSDEQAISYTVAGRK